MLAYFGDWECGLGCSALLYQYQTPYLSCVFGFGKGKNMQTLGVSGVRFAPPPLRNLRWSSADLLCLTGQLDGHCLLTMVANWLLRCCDWTALKANYRLTARRPWV